MRFDPLNPTPDFNGDNRSDVYWRNDAYNLNATWLMDGPRISKVSFLPDVPEEAGWTKTSFGDFNGDSKTDFFWRNTITGANVIWLMNGDRIANGYATLAATPNWDYKVVDFNGDGTSDLLWHNKSTGLVVSWIFKNGNLQEAKVLGTVTPEWDAYVADFNADKKTDLLWRNTRSGDNVVWMFNGSTLTQGFSIGVKSIGWTPKIADLNGDGRSDIFWHNASGANQATLWSSSSVYPQSTIDLPTTLADIGSRTLDARFEIVHGVTQDVVFTYDPFLSKASLWTVVNQVVTTVEPNFGGISISAVDFKFSDFDGDTNADVWAYDRGTGSVAISNSANNYQGTNVIQLDPSLGWKAITAA